MHSDTPFTTQLPTDGEHALIRELRLEVVEGVDAGATFRSTRERAVIGTHPSTDLVLRDPAVSRFHCELVLLGSRVLVRDLDSRNGTTIDGVTIAGAYLQAPATITLGKTTLRFSLGDENVRIRLSSRERFGGLRGRSQAMRACFALLESAASSDVTVLLTGETGAGKDAAAEAIHHESERARGPFVVVDCGAIPGHLLEDELFGHERGAFTGATATRAGALEAADGGTLFLDEIGELPLDLQPKLLRAVESRRVRRVGGDQPVSVDTRIVAATNRNLKAEVNAHRFRADLYFRLAVLEISLPPLRDRLDDLPLILEELIAVLRLDASPGARALLEPGALANLRAHPWPGNVRELRNYVERCAALDRREPLDPGTGAPGDMPALDATLPIREARERWVRWFERQYLERLLELHQGNVTAAARTAGVDRIHLHRLMSKLGLKR
ncbi:MAG TPA: sigma 54-interacting transcriptional regulator [Kofleriaceae bacterium]|nr:sigma 54-interacting transcriptional regulator [Kofleriaceae bacterium]